MKVELSEEVQSLVEIVESVLAAGSRPDQVREAWTDPSQARCRLWPQLCGIGLPGVTRSEERGGGLSLEDLMPVMEAAGRHAATVPLAESVGAACPVLAGESGDQAFALLAQLDAGEAFVTVQDGWDGWAPWASQADYVLVLDGDQVAVCQPDEDGLERLESQDGSRWIGRVAPSTRKWNLEQLHPARTLRAHVTVATAATLNGLSAGVISQAVEYAKVRYQFGQPIGSFQAVRHRLAAAFARLEFTRRYAYYAAWTVATGSEEAAVTVPRAKALAGDVAGEASYAALQVHGGIGYTWEHDLHLWMKRIQALDGAYGTSEQHWSALAHASVDAGTSRETP